MWCPWRHNYQVADVGVDVFAVFGVKADGAFEDEEGLVVLMMVELSDGPSVYGNCLKCTISCQ